MYTEKNKVKLSKKFREKMRNTRIKRRSLKR